MLWLLVLHISALLVWCAALLYLPAIMAGIASGSIDLQKTGRPDATVQRLVFTHLATPSALVAIMAGTLVFVFNGTVDAWLIAKLTLVVGLVISHILTGLVVLAATGSNDASSSQRPADSMPITLQCAVLGITQSVLIIAIFWTVLAKPSVVPVH